MNMKELSKMGYAVMELKNPFTPAETMAARKEQLKHTFIFLGKPYCIAYEYRRKFGKTLYQNDLPVLREFIKEKKVELIEVTSTKKVYHWIAPVE